MIPRSPPGGRDQAKWHVLPGIKGTVAKVYVLGGYARVEVVQAAAAASGSTRAGRDRHAPRGECVGSGAEGPSRRRIREAPDGGN